VIPLRAKLVLVAAILFSLWIGSNSAAQSGSGFHASDPPGLVTKGKTDLMTAPDPRTPQAGAGHKVCHWSRNRQTGSCPTAPDAQIGNRCKCPLETIVGQAGVWVLVDGFVRAVP